LAESKKGVYLPLAAYRWNYTVKT